MKHNAQSPVMPASSTMSEHEIFFLVQKRGVRGQFVNWEIQDVRSSPRISPRNLLRAVVGVADTLSVSAIAREDLLPEVAPLVGGADSVGLNYFGRIYQLGILNPREPAGREILLPGSYMIKDWPLAPLSALAMRLLQEQYATQDCTPLVPQCVQPGQYRISLEEPLSASRRPLALTTTGRRHELANA